MRCLVQQLNRTFSCHSLTSRCLHHGALSHFLYPVIFVFFSLLVEILEKKYNPKLLILDHFVTFNVTEMSKQSKYYFLSNRNFLHLFQFFLSQHNGTWYMIFNLIKITSLTCSPFLICRGVGDLKKLHYQSVPKTF